MCLDISASWFIIVTAILVSAFYFYHNQIEDPDKIEIAESWKDFKFFRLEYEQLNENIRSRDNMTIVAGSILITASILIFTSWRELETLRFAFGSKILIVFALLAIYIIWMIVFNMTSNKLNNIAYARLREMEKHAPGKSFDPDNFMKLHRHVREQTKNKWWLRLRRAIWVFFLWVLVIISVFIILY